MIDNQIITYLERIMTDAYPEIKRDQYIIALPSGKMEQQQMNCTILASEILPVFIGINSDDRIDRVPFIRALGGINFTADLDGTPVKVRYLGHDHKNLVEMNGHEETSLKLEFTHHIERI